MRVAQPFSDDDVSRLFAGLAAYELLVVAVSGGPDSMALLHLLNRWQVARGDDSPRIAVATVDHALRAGSTLEAEWVAAQSASMGFAHRTLRWASPQPEASLQEAAREARYDLLLAHTRSFGVASAAILTAHTRDDQAETLLMRLKRGSGVDGLSGMPEIRCLSVEDNIRLVRPLLGTAKEALIDELRSAGRAWLTDPSNASDAFERVQIRAARDDLERVGLTNAQLARSASRLRRARAALDEFTAEAERRLVDMHGGAYASVGIADWQAQPEELRIRLLTRLLAAFGGVAPAARLSEVERLAAELAGNARLASALGGCIIRRTARRLEVYREFARRPLPEFALVPGQACLWDDRFVVQAHWPVADQAPVVVRALGRQTYATLKHMRALRAALPSRAAAGLPSFWQSDALICVPQLEFAADTVTERHVACKSHFVGSTQR